MVHLVRPLLQGADGVFVGSCLPGECHYTGGNVEALGRVRVLGMILERIGLDRRRLVMKMMSSAEGPKFVQYVTEFAEVLGAVGPLGESEGISKDDLRIRLTAALRAVEGPKLRWVAGKCSEFSTRGNLYGEVFTDHEIGRMLREVVADEMALQEIRLRLEGGAMTALEVASALGDPPPVVVRRLADLLRLGRVEMSENGDAPLWRATG
jgi:F420-non-reducing hydrogenase iron-sulfur subunit